MCQKPTRDESETKIVGLFCVLFGFVLVYFGLFWFILVYFGLCWFILVYFGFVWFLLVSGVFCLVYFGLFWFILVSDTSLTPTTPIWTATLTAAFLSYSALWDVSESRIDFLDCWCVGDVLRKIAHAVTSSGPCQKKGDRLLDSKPLREAR